MLKTNSYTDEIKDCNGEKIIGAFMKRNYHLVTYSGLTRQSKVLLYLSNYAAKEELEHAEDVNTFDLVAKKILLFQKLNFTK